MKGCTFANDNRTGGASAIEANSIALGLHRPCGRKRKIVIDMEAINYKTNIGRPTYDRIHFATMALESGARRLGITPLAMYRRLKQQDLIQQRLLRHYDMLHTQSLDYVAEDIAETLKNWEEEQP